jgi:hypothetical protein
LYNDIRTLCAKEASLVVQSGDFTEGLCGNYTLAERQLNEFIHFTENMIHAPFLISKGNHDITGPGADSAYKSIIFPFLERQTGNPIHDSKYVYIKDNTAFFFYDSYDRTSLDWLAEQMKKFRDVPVKFVIMHEPVVPINARSKWTEFSGASEKENHDMLLELLGNNNAIVLAGHLHAYGLVVRKTNHGRFIQLSGSSVVDNLNQEPDQVISGINSYGVSLIDLEPGFSPADKDERRAILLKEKPFILYFEYALLQGYMVIHVNQEKITAELYTGTGLKKWKTVDLTGLLKN